MDYRVQLDQYSGPMDLLLYLVRRNELDLRDLPLAAIAEQFLEFVEILQELDLELVGEFVVMASTLLEIKSRQVLPQAEETPQVVEVQENPRADLVAQLLAYKKYKDAAQLLENQSAEWQQRYPRLSDDRPSASSDPSEDRIKEVELWDLVSALSRVLKRNTQSAPKSIVYDDTPISVYIERIRIRVLAEGQVPFSSLFAGSHTRSKIVGIFLAILELLRHYQFRAQQLKEYGEIVVMPPLQLAVSTVPGDSTLSATELLGPALSGAEGSAPALMPADSDLPGTGLHDANALAIARDVSGPAMMVLDEPSLTSVNPDSISLTAEVDELAADVERMFDAAEGQHASEIDESASDLTAPVEPDSD